MKWRKEYSRIKSEYKTVLTNYTMSSKDEKECEKIFKGERYYATLYRDIDKYVFEFVVADYESLDILLKELPTNTVINILYREYCEFDDFFRGKGLTMYSTYQRTTISYHSNPYLVPETSKRRQLLPQMYDATCGEYPSIDDAEELDALCRKVFDPLCDDMFTIEEWKQKIRDKEVMVYRSPEGITAYYLWRIEGKKLYSNMSVNIGAANTLYNIERRIFEEAWEKGIRVFYGWGRLTNIKAKNHAMPADAIYKCASSISRLKCNTYLKR